MWPGPSRAGLLPHKRSRDACEGCSGLPSSSVPPLSVLGILLQGATAAGVSLWSSLKGPILESTLESRFGEVWVCTGTRLVGLGRAAPAAGGRRSRWPIALLGLGAAYLAVTPALAGHASTEGPVAVFFPPTPARAGGERVGGRYRVPVAGAAGARAPCSRAPSAAGCCFDARALLSAGAGAVVAIASTGVIQAYIDVRSLDGLLDTTYGALILVKSSCCWLLICLGWVNRERVIPGTARVVGAGVAGRVGALARRTMRGELALMLCVFGVTAALVTYAPPIDAAAGPFSTTRRSVRRSSR